MDENSITDEEAEKIKLEIDQLKMELPAKIPATILPAANSKFLQKINPPENVVEVYKLVSGNYKIELKSPAFINRLLIHTDDPKKISSAVTVIVNVELDKNPKTFKLSEKPGFSVCYINDFVTSFELDVNYGLLQTRATLTKIEIVGYTRSQLDTLSGDLAAWFNKKGELEKWYSKSKENIAGDRAKLVSETQQANDELAAIEEKVQEAETEFEDVHKNLIDLQSQIAQEIKLLTDTKVEFAKTKTEIESMAAQQERIADSIQKKNIELKGLNENIVSTEEKLRKLEASKNLFTDTIEGYAKQGRNNVIFYTVASLPFIAILVYVTAQLFIRAEEMLLFFSEEQKYSIYDVIFSKLPFMFISILLIQASYYICKAFIVRIMEIHRERLALSRVMVIAGEVSDSSSDGLDDLTDDQKYTLRRMLKMEMLRSHLSKDVSDDYDIYKVEGNFDKAISGPIQKVINFFKTLNKAKITDNE